MGELTSLGNAPGGALSTLDEAAQFLTFFAAEERYAIDILDVSEIIEIGPITRVPMTPEYIRGVINLRGSVVPVVDLCARLGKQRCELSKRSAIILVELETHAERHLIGMLVDEVHEIVEIAATHRQPPPDFGAEIRTDFIQGMGRVDDTFIILLDINRVLSADELSRLTQATAHAPLPRGGEFDGTTGG